MRDSVHLFQIFYDAATRAALDPGFEPLDNSANERPDWYEYWPIRRFFAGRALDPQAFYGFVSPLFFSKTRLTGAQARDFIARHPEADVVTFSPHPCHGAVFYNVFEQGANCFPGFLEVAVRFLQEVEPGLSLERLVNDSHSTVYSNYFAAKPAFWSAWNGIFERLFAHAESPASPLHELLNRGVRYAKDDGEAKPTQMKIHVMERIASMLLATRRFAVRNYPPFEMPVSAGFLGHEAELVALDRLKIDYQRTGDARLLQEFVERRGRLAAIAFPRAPA